MKKYFKIAGMAWLFISLLMGTASAASILGLDNPDRIANRYIVVFKDSAIQANASASVSSMAQSLAQSVGGNVVHTYDAVLNGFSVTLPDNLAAELAKHPSVDYVEADGMAHANAVASWGLDRVDQRDLPLDTIYNPDFDGTGINAYIIDTGINPNHVDFGGRVTLAHNAMGDGRDASDCHGHGTHVAGTVGGSSYGVAKKVKLYAVRALDCNGSAPWSNVIAGMDWIKTNRVDPAVANISISGGTTTSVNTAANNLMNSGVFLAVAAGNEGRDACQNSPAAASDVMTVGNTQDNDGKNFGSNYGSCVHIFAPGTNIVSASYNNNNGSSTMTGTSMAAPHVAGAAALLLQENTSRTPAQLKSLLVSNASSGKVGSPGSGSPNKLLYIGSGSNPPPPPPPPPPAGRELENGVAVTGLSGASASNEFYTMVVPSGANNLSFKTSGGTGDVDLYVRFGSKPTTSVYDCRPYVGGNAETCNITNVQTGTYHVMLRGYNAYSGASLVGSYTTGNPPPPPANEVIVDNTDSGKTSSTGTWSTSSGSSPYGSNSVYCDSGCTFTWSPGLSEAGSYQVYAWWTTHANRSTTVPITVNHSAGSETYTVNQQASGGQWVLLGTHNFSAGSGSVQVSSVNGQASADAVKFVKQ